MPTNAARLASPFYRIADKTTFEANGCILFHGADNGTGYGYGNRGGRTVLAHRVSYEAVVGPVPKGLELDHLCRNRRCVNPAHLEPVSHRENVLRGDSIGARNAKKTHCLRGHPFITVNWKDGRVRTCRYRNRCKAHGVSS